MAHEEHNINWNILAANLIHRSPSYPAADMVSNLYFRFKPTQGQEIGSFIESFVRTLEKHTQDERRKYPDQYSPFTLDELVLNDRVAEQIRPLAHRWCKAYKWPLEHKIHKTEGLCRHVDSESFACGCSLPYHERKGAAFQRSYRWNSCYTFYAENTEVFYNLQVLNALLVLGEMDTVLRLCATPDNNLEESMLVGTCRCVEADLGWDQVFEAALNIYLLLNILYCFPELWDPASRQARNKKRTDEYRATRMYQQTVKIWTHDGSKSDISRHPHRQFFGLEGHFSYSLQISRGWDRPVLAQLREKLAKDRWWLKKTPEQISELFVDDEEFPYGKLPFEEFLACGKGGAAGVKHQTRSVVDVARVEAYLRAKRLPQELVLQITACTEYDRSRSRSRLPVPHDPLHRRNRRQLRRHLDHCWRIMVHCNMLARELGTKIDWELRVVEALDRMVSSPAGMKLSEREAHESDEFWQTTLRGGSGELPYSIPDPD
ncbi:hypothetical protein CNMCM8980_006240 [Aspergillus fumigatiaffinis]|uniref:Uncharacterized protein n=1 Tax=Aspergillus fumigatiaffinis TaxID=340414 RepID=A0A8H4EG14_9EURO|nr:hypothetical protein CNMCM5878_006106 [Aspergillus fumigatiaffinis]KAF4220114.1 hypothetical protein CNMCM6457_002575 [Aspergillus fumigatiaffinis]KAF4227610.1 hypothetical protein CNMCM6805_002825 [Aspergillus fumigatiaffinis]KAF4229559.1 hypothetical protein CNMCM8980_006240 [Aspergillus fumigatiaffinis]